MANTKRCTVETCDREHHQRGFCQKHYWQIRRHGEVAEATRRDPRPAIVEADIAKIPLGLNAKDGYAVVDKEFSYLANDNWCMSLGYAIRSKDMVRMHRLITKAPLGMDVDHINMNRVDNRMVNLRVCSHAENSRNGREKATNKSGYKGVFWNAKDKKFQAQVKLDYKYYPAGYFDTAEDAARAYDKKALELHGEFARLNFG